MRLPRRATDSLAKMARYFDLSSEALLRRYVGVGLREDEARYFAEQALSTMEDVLRERLGEELAASLVREAEAELGKRANTRTRPATPRAG